MATVHELPCDVDLELEDGLWWAAESADDDAPPPPEHTGRAWLLAEAAEWEARSARRGASDPTGHLLLAGSLLRAAAAGMRLAGHDEVGPYLADPSTVPGPSPLRLAWVRPGDRRSPLAAALDVVAAWYAHLDTDAGDFAAWSLLYAAGDAEEWGSADRAEYYQDEAAYLMACTAVAEEEWDPGPAPFDPAEL